MQYQIHFILAEATPVPEFTALQQDQLLQKRAPSSTTTTEAGSGLLTSPREKNKSKFPYFSPWASQRTGAVPYFRLSLSNFAGRGRKATARNTCGLLGYSSAGQTTWVPEFFFSRLLRSSSAEMFQGRPYRLVFGRRPKPWAANRAGNCEDLAETGNRIWKVFVTQATYKRI